VLFISAGLLAAYHFCAMGKKENERKGEKSKNAKMPRVNKIHAMCIIAVFTALMCVLSPLSIPLEPVSITLATLVVYLIGAVFSWKISLPIILIYLLLGMVGMPVFSKFQGGIQVLVGPTGGFLIGYIPCLLFESLLLGKTKKRLWAYPLAMLGGTIFLYACGLAWFLIYGKGNYDFAKAMMVCVVPFLPGDAIKIALASFAGYRLRKFVDGEFGNPW
jgi:biotin transport system substrate-specific component